MFPGNFLNNPFCHLTNFKYVSFHLKFTRLKNPVTQSSFLSKALSFLLTLFWFQWKWQRFWKKWGSRNCHGFLRWTNFSDLFGTPVVVLCTKTKSRFISNCLFGALVSTKIPMKIFQASKKKVKSKKVPNQIFLINLKK